MKKQIKNTQAIFPMPVLLISTFNEDGSVDVMNHETRSLLYSYKSKYFFMHILSVNFLLIFFCLIAAYVSNYYQVYIKDIKSLFFPSICLI